MSQSIAQDAKLAMLQLQNSNLSSELAVQRQETHKLEQALTDLKAQQTAYNDTLAGVDRLWQQLNRDIQFLCQRFTRFPATEQSLKTEEDSVPDSSLTKQEPSEGQAGSGAFKQADPFLQRLISTQHADAAAVQRRLDDMAEDATSVERALQPRVEATLSAFARLVEVYDAETAKLHEAAAKMASGDSGELEMELRNLREEKARLLKEVDAQKAVSRTTEAQLRQLNDLQQKDEAEIQRLSNELADKSEELVAAQRKLYTLRTESGALPSLASQASLPLHPQLSRKGSMAAAAPASGIEADESLKVAQKELKAERERSEALAKQLRDATAKLQDEGFVSQTVLYQLAQTKLQAQSAELDKFRKITDSLQREREAILHREQGLHHQVEAGKQAQRMLGLTEGRVRELEQKLDGARTAAETAELTLQQHKERSGNYQSVQELKSMVATLEQQVGSLRGSVAKREDLLTQLQAAKTEARVVLAKAEAKDMELQQLKRKMATWEGDLAALQNKEKDLQAVAEDLRVFVEVLQNFCEDPREVAEVRASEAKLKAQLTSAQKQAQGLELQVSMEAMKRTEAETQARAAEVLQENSALQLEVADLRRQAADLQEHATNLRAESEAYSSEIEVIGGAYEDMQAKNSRLLQQLTERDDVANQLMTERIQAAQRASHLAEERNAAQAAARLAEQKAVALQEHASSLDIRLRGTMDELASTRERTVALTTEIERLKAEGREREAALKQKEALLGSVQAASEQRKRALDEEAEKLQREKVRRQRLEEENKVLQNNVDRLRKDDGSGGAADDAELEGLRTLLRCNVCHQRQKDVIITKCWHMFCHHCIRRNLETRNRKCPGCGTLFGQQDVKQFFFT